MAKKTDVTTTHVVTEENVQDVTNDLNRVNFAPVEKLESLAKVGFYCEQRQADDSMLEPLLRLCCESKDPDGDSVILTPWCTSATLGAMVQGCMYLNPLILKCIKENQKNAETPNE